MITISDNLQLYPLSPDDIPVIFHTIDSERDYLKEWLPFVERTTSISYTQAYVEDVIKQELIQYSIYRENKFAGLIGFNLIDLQNGKSEIGYWLSEKFQGNGIITYAVKALLKKGFTELKLNSIRIKTAVNNIKSRKIPERLNFQLEGIERDGELLTNGKFTDLAIYSILKKEYIL